MIEVEVDKIMPLNELKNNTEKITQDIQNSENPENLYVFINSESKPVAALINIDYLKKLTGKEKIPVKKQEQIAPAPAPTPIVETTPIAPISSMPDIPSAEKIIETPSSVNPPANSAPSSFSPTGNVTFESAKPASTPINPAVNPVPPVVEPTYPTPNPTPATPNSMPQETPNQAPIPPAASDLDIPL